MEISAQEYKSTKNDSELKRPTIFFKTITFSDGSKLDLDADDIVVFVGPNNTGKSAALRELNDWVARSNPGLVIKQAELNREGTEADLRNYLEANAQVSGEGVDRRYGGIGYSIHQSNLNYFNNPEDRHPIAPIFVRQLATETRITDSNAAPNIKLHREPPSHPIHLLLMDQVLAKDISNKFKHAFGKDLTPFRAGGSSYPLYVGNKPSTQPEHDEISKEFVDALLDSNDLLEKQGDGMRSFVAVMLHVLAARAHSIQLLDEPEAFLHPPQAKLLGRYIAEGNKGISQLFIATHSTDVLEGLIDGGSEKVRIVRVRREGNVNHIKELDKKRTKSVTNDPFARYSRVFDGVFFEHVVICESDADCMFYGSLLNLPEISGDRRPDVFFIHAAGKHRMSNLAETLRALDVPVSVIVDIDILNDKNTFAKLFENLGGEWDEVEANWQAVSNHVINKGTLRNAEQIADKIKSEIEGVTGSSSFPTNKVRNIQRILRSISPWSAMKNSGRSALSSGGPVNQFDELCEKCEERQLWIVQVGELEGFCRSIGSHGPLFVEEVLEKRDLARDDELQDAREFIARVWKRARS